MNVQCQHCHALHFDGEKLSASTQANTKFGMCCLQGQVQLPPISDPPATLCDLLYGRCPLSPHFHKHIHQYNAALAFISLGVCQGTTLRHPLSFCTNANPSRDVPNIRDTCQRSRDGQTVRRWELRAGWTMHRPFLVLS
jgi:hypothetical protein